MRFFGGAFSDAEQLFEIVMRRMQGLDRGWLSGIIEHFNRIRQLQLAKRPATAEFLAWAALLRRMDLDLRGRLNSERREQLTRSYAALLKTEEDLRTVRREMDRVDER
jgi:hypothetical protein